MKDEQIILALNDALLTLFSKGEAVDFLVKLFISFQNIDDVYDGETTDKDEIVSLCISGITIIGADNFYSRHKDKLAPLVESAYLQWQSANKMEESGKASEKSYMLRAYYYQIVHFVASLVYGQKYAVDKSVEFQELYGELYINYKEEFKNA